MIGWVYNAWLLHQLWKMKVFCYFSKFLFTCRVHSGVVLSHTTHVLEQFAYFTARIILDIIFLMGSTFSSNEPSAMSIYPLSFPEQPLLRKNYLTTLFLSLWNKNLLLISKINFLIIKMFTKMFQDRKNTTFTTGSKFTFAVMVDVEILSPVMCTHLKTMYIDLNKFSNCTDDKKDWRQFSQTKGR